jgi:alanine dehydrogenase
VRALRDAGAVVVLETGAGEASGFGDLEYRDAGGAIVPSASEAWSADLVVKVKEPLPEEFRLLSNASVLFTFLHLAAVPILVEELLTRRVTAIAYETVASGGALPILRPMSEVAGILSIQVGARGLERGSGGRGILLSAPGGSSPGDVAVLGAGVAGRNAARTAAGIGANVTILDVNAEKLESANRECGGKARTIRSTTEAIAGVLKETDLLVSTVLLAGERAPRLVTREMIRSMRPGSVAVDVAIDQGGSLETSRPTTLADPYFIEERVVHYCVTNMPSAVPRTSTKALAAAVLPYLLSFAMKGVAGALRTDEGLLAGLNTHCGNVTCAGVAKAFGMPYMPPRQAIG